MLKKETASDIILEAKAIRKQIEKQLKENVQEQFAPSIKAMVDAKLQETAEAGYGEDDEDENMEEAFDINSLLETSDEDASEAPVEASDELNDEPTEETGEDVSIANMTKEDLIAVFKDVIEDYLGDKAGTEDSTELPDMGSEDDGELDEEDNLTLESILSELSESDDKDKDDVEKLKQENLQLQEAIKILKQSINESSLGNAHLKFVSKLSREGNLAQEQIVKISESFDKMKSVSEMERAYNLLKESFVAKKVTKTANNKQAIKEGILKNTFGQPAQKSKLNESAGVDQFQAKINKILGK